MIGLIFDPNLKKPSIYYVMKTTLIVLKNSWKWILASILPYCTATSSYAYDLFFTFFIFFKPLWLLTLKKRSAFFATARDHVVNFFGSLNEVIAPAAFMASTAAANAIFAIIVVVVHSKG